MTLHRQAVNDIDFRDHTLTACLHHPKLGRFEMILLTTGEGQQARFILPGSFTATMMPGEYFWEVSLVRKSDGFVQKYPRDNSVVFDLVRGG